MFGIRKTASNKPVFDSVFIVQPVDANTVTSASPVSTPQEISGNSYNVESAEATFRAELAALQDKREELLAMSGTKAVQANMRNEQIREHEQGVRNSDLTIQRLEREIMSGNLSNSQTAFNRILITTNQERKDTLLIQISVLTAEVERLESEVASLMSAIQEIDTRIGVIEENL